jgi:hypothetical protein
MAGYNVHSQNINLKGGKMTINWNKINAITPIVQWVWGGIFTIALGTCYILYDMKMESVELKHQVELQKKVDESQDKKIEAVIKAVEQISKGQKKQTEALNDLKLTLVNQQHNLVRMVEESKKANELLGARLDSHIALENQKRKGGN